MHRFILLGSLIVVALSTAATAQQATSMLVGRVVDEQGAVLPGVTVVVTNQDLGTSRTALTNDDGSYFMPALIPGMYSVAAEMSGFSRFTQEEVPLRVGATMNLEIVLAIGSIEETVTVTAESPLIDVTSKEVGGYIQSEELMDTPTFNRNFTGFLDLVPGVIATGSTASFAADSIQVNGQDPTNVAYTFDGASNDDDHLGGSAGAQARIPMEAVQEFQLMTGQFDAEFGNSSGGVLNVISKSGTNTMHGSAFGFFKTKALTAEDHFVKTKDLEKPKTSEQQYGFTVGGPIIQDRLHYFGSLERVAINKGVTINIPTRPEFNRAEVENIRPWNLFARGDFQINANHTIGGRWLWETSPSDHYDNDWAPGTQEFELDHDWVLGGSLISLVGDNKVSTLRFGVVYEDLHWESSQEVLDSGGSQINARPFLEYNTYEGGDIDTSFQRVNTTFHLEDTVSWFVPDKGGDHNFKFGAQYKYMDLDYRQSNLLNGSFEFDTDLDFDAANPSTYPERLNIQQGDRLYNLNGHVIGSFFQDDWSINNRVTLSLGLRYDVEVMETPSAQNPFYSSAGDAGGCPLPCEKYPVDKNNLAPRLGFTVGLDDEGHSVLRGGYGRFYQKFRLARLDNLFTDLPFTDAFDVFFPANGVDPGPSSGQFPTDPMLVNGPTVNRALLDSLFPPGSTQRNQGTIQFDGADRENSYAETFSIGYERQLAPDLSVSFDYIHLIQRDQLILFNWNQEDRTGTSRRDPTTRPDDRYVNNVYQLQNAASIDHDALQVQFDKRLSNNYRFRISYTLGTTRGNTRQGDAETIWTQVGKDLNLDQNIGPGDFDRRHNLVANATYLTGGLRLSTIVRLRSGTPFSLIDSTFDLNQNGEDDDEWLPAGTYSGEGPDGFTVDFDGGRNGARGPRYFQWDIRAGYDFELGGGNVFQVYADLINVVNNSNFRAPSRTRGGDLRRSNFMVLQRLVNNGLPRTLQIGLRFGF